MNERYWFDVEFCHDTLTKEYKAMHNYPTTKRVIEFGAKDFYSSGFNGHVLDQVAVKFKEEYSLIDNDFNWVKMKDLVDGLNWSILDGKIRISILLRDNFFVCYPSRKQF